jgi:DNA (cytosine-5)-methyltransferase 1
MNYLSVCSGIEAATVAWHPLGWKAVGFSEIEKFPSQVLAHHYSDVPNLGDMTKFKEWNLESNVDVFVGGTPCQSFSVAGLRKGLDDPRGNLMLTYLAIANQYRPKWLVWENVPGVLSSNGGRDFATFLGGLGELGYGFAYRVLDAQYFGVAQRRRRVFVVGYLGDWRRAAAVLFERHSLSWDIAPSREKRKSSSPSTRAGSPNGSQTIGPLMARDYKGFCNQDFQDGRGLVLEHDCGVELSGPLSARDYKDAGTDGINKNSAKMIPVYSLQGAGKTSQNSQGSCWNEDISFTLNRLDVHGIAQPIPFGVSEKPDVSHCLRSGASKADKHESTTYIAQPISFDMAQITSKVNGTRVEPGLPVSTLAKGIQMHVAQPIFFEPRSPDGVPRIYPMDGASPTLNTMQGGGLQPCVTHAVGTDLYNGAITGDVAATMSTHGGDGTGTGPTVMQPIGFEANMSLQQPSTGGVFQTLTRRTHASVNVNMAVRRLSPVECERLQGFPDNYTDIMPKGKTTPDGPRYKALGNSMAVPVMAWIGKRIQEVENIK